jgi:hypothetical protein
LDGTGARFHALERGVNQSGWSRRNPSQASKNASIKSDARFANVRFPVHDSQQWVESGSEYRIRPEGKSAAPI